ncbi:MAG: hypothetical protein DSM106950_41170 [Stigonema ocellatum SAG 48.90 = DSM 106950]|nr:hypothetical protein [Stigonema ocellatum SAG 48.90 = DSM 106950]
MQRPKLHFVPLATISWFPVHFQLPCIGPKGWLKKVVASGSPPEFESVAVKFPSLLKVISSLETLVGSLGEVLFARYVPTTDWQLLVMKLALGGNILHWLLRLQICLTITYYELRITNYELF